MEDATITTGDKESIITNNRFPMIVDTDDLVWELGRKDVDILNKEKLLERLLKKTDKLNNDFLSIQKLFNELNEECSKLKTANTCYEQSNKQLSDTNKQLSDALFSIKEELTNSSNIVMKLTNDNKLLKESNTNFERNNKILGDSLAQVRQEMSNDIRTIETLKFENERLKSDVTKLSEERNSFKFENEKLNLDINKVHEELDTCKTLINSTKSRTKATKKSGI